MDIAKHQSVPKLKAEDLVPLFNDFASVEYIQELVNALPYVGAILTKERQIVFANQHTVEQLKSTDINFLIGLRPGDAVNCVNAKKGPNGCGSSAYCRYCGAFRSICESQDSHSKIVNDCRITITDDDEQLKALDLKVTSTPFNFKGYEYTVFTIEDISEIKRKRLLERIFYHDLLNHSGSLNGFIQILKETEDQTQQRYFIQLLEEITIGMIDEIRAQKELSAAENKELTVKMEHIPVRDLIESIAVQFNESKIFENKKVEMDQNIPDITIKTDPVLLRRCILNMVKNALEAVKEQQSVSISTKPTSKGLKIAVHNPTFIPEEIQLQIFQRSFSTKDPSRGLGTYSLKILGENYLKGTVGFTSDVQKGTVFFIDLPLL